MDRREEDLRFWAGQQVKASGALQWSSVAGDASSRRYFRLRDGKRSWIAADAPPATEKNDAFLQIRALLANAGLRAPQLVSADTGRGFLLLEDLGDALLLGQLNESSVDTYYQQAMDTLARAQAVSCDGLPVYAEAVLAEEYSRFSEWFCQGLLQLQLDKAEQDIVARAGEQLIASALAQPQVFVHRDYHSRNLLLLPDGDLGLIDFQDAVRGPLCYDLVSLLRDCYIRWPVGQVKAWALEFRARLLAMGRPAGEDEAEFLRWFDWAGLHRHLKVLGNFARLSLRDGKHAYLDDVPMVNDYVVSVLAEHVGLEEFAHWYRDRVEPNICRISGGGPG
jgi:aminoglycoside/choline kinase family phosphotransferase